MDMRRFELHRDHDVTGVSGEGVVAEGVRFTDGSVVLRWMSGEHRTTVLHTGIASVEAVNGHGGHTRVVWVDDLVARQRFKSAAEYAAEAERDDRELVRRRRELDEALKLATAR